MEAQRYPEDFDAIIAGAPVYNQVHLNESQVSLQVEMLKEPARLVPAAKVTLFNNAVLAACDEKDGVKDGIVSDPRTCKFDPATLLCKGGDGADCFTAAQVDSAKKAYAPVTTKSGELVYPGHSPGFEFGWRIPTTAVAMNALFADMPRYLGRQDANFDLMSFDLDTDLALALKNGAVIESSDPNLAKFKARGGKLLMYHGWADPGPAPENTISYYNAVTKSLGGAKQDDWMRLFLMPGMGHCTGGVGPDQADFLGAMEAWKEKGTAPNQIVAARNGGGRSGLTPMTRPLCPFPQLAKYSGTGSTDDSKSFVCSAP
jgi:feruloyl esterase